MLYFLFGLYSIGMESGNRNRYMGLKEQDNSQYTTYDCFFSNFIHPSVYINNNAITEPIKLTKCTFINFNISSNEAAGAVYITAGINLSTSFIIGEKLYCGIIEKDVGIYGQFESIDSVNLNFTCLIDSGKGNVGTKGMNYLISKQVNYDNVNVTNIKSGYRSLYFSTYRGTFIGSTLIYCNFCNLTGGYMITSYISHNFQYCNLIDNTGAITSNQQRRYEFRNCNLVAPDNMRAHSIENSDNHAIGCYINEVFYNRINGGIEIINSQNTSVEFTFVVFDPNQFKTAPPVTPHITPFLTNEITPRQTPFVTNDATPALTPFITIDKTPFQTPILTNAITPHQTPFITNEITPVLTPIGTEAITPNYTPQLTPFSTIEKTPHITPFMTEETTPYKTPYQTASATAAPVITEPINGPYLGANGNYGHLKRQYRYSVH